MASVAPELALLITSLILERPMCLSCITQRANASLDDVAGSFLRIKRVLHLRRYATERCRACGIEGLVFALERPSGPRARPIDIARGVP